MLANSGSLIPDPLRVILFLYHMNNVYDGTMDPGSVALDTGLSVDYDLATPVSLFRLHPLLFFLTDPRSYSISRTFHRTRDQVLGGLNPLIAKQLGHDPF